MTREEVFARQFGAVALEVGATVAGYAIGARYKHPHVGGFVGFLIGGAAGWWVSRPAVEASPQNDRTPRYLSQLP